MTPRSASLLLGGAALAGIALCWFLAILSRKRGNKVAEKRLEKAGFVCLGILFLSFFIR